MSWWLRMLTKPWHYKKWTFHFATVGDVKLLPVHCFVDFVIYDVSDCTCWQTAFTLQITGKKRPTKVGVERVEQTWPTPWPICGESTLSQFITEEKAQQKQVLENSLELYYELLVRVLQLISCWCWNVLRLHNESKLASCLSILFFAYFEPMPSW